MWTYNILDKRKIDEETIAIDVEFVKGTNSFKRTLVARRDQISRNWLDSQLKKETDVYDNAKSLITGLSKGAYSMQQEATPTQEQIDRTNFIMKARKLINMNKLVQVGVLQASDLDALRQEVVSLYNENWTEFI